MGTIFQMTFANVKRKKFRTVLIVLSIVLSVALLYAVLSMTATITNVFDQKIRKEVGNTQFILTPKETSSDHYLTDLDFDSLDGLSYHIPVLTSYGYSELDGEAVPVIFTGMDFADYQTIYPMEYLKGSGDSDAPYPAVIGEQASLKCGLDVGSTVTVQLLGKPYAFEICGILKEQSNSLGYEAGSLKLLVSKETLSFILNLEQQVSAYYIKGEGSLSITDLKEELEKAFPDLQLQNMTDMSDYKQMISMIVTCLMFMVLAVLMVSTFIIYSSFKIIVIERMPFLGTLRSIGATRRTANAILLLEALFYGLIGGILGIALGILILYGTLNIMFQNFGVTLEQVSYVNWSYLLISLLLGLLLVLCSALPPVIKTGKKSIKSIIFAEISNDKHFSLPKTLLGLLFIAAAFVLFLIAPLSLQLLFDMTGFILICIGGALVIPLLSLLLTALFSLLLRPIFRDALGVTTANIKNDRTIMNNVLLLAMGLAIILMINNFSSTVSTAVTDVYRTGKADALAFCDFDDSFLTAVGQLPGVEHVYSTKGINDIPVNDGKFTLPILEGIDGLGYSQYAWDEFGSYLTEDILKEFTGSRSIILSRFIAKKFKLEVGDSLKLDFNGKFASYKVIEIVPSIMNNGNVCFVYDKFLAADAGIENYQSLYVNIKEGADTKQVLQKMKELLPDTILPVQTLSDMQSDNVKSNNAIFFLMKAISFIAMFIGIVGILNNFTISFLSRKKLIATLRSLGLSKSNAVRTMLLEAFLCGCLGTVSGLILGTILLKAMCYLVEALGLPSEIMFYNYKDYLFVLLSGIILSLVSAVLPAISIAKDNIVAGLRYE